VPLEPTFNYIDDFNTAWPNNDPDQLAEADDHLRGIKAGTKGSFPNLGQEAVTASAADLNRVSGNASVMLALVYPVGAIYCSASSLSPDVLFGFGTWAALADKQTLVQQGTYPAGSAGGSSTAINVTHNHGSGSISASSSGSHSHDIYYNGSGGGANPYNGNAGGTANSVTNVVGSARTSGAHTHNISGNTSTDGASGSNANMPPYLAVYMWQRTA